MDKTRLNWEQRSKKYKDDIRGVLPKSFPLWLNNYLHKWMYWQVKRQINEKDKVLDLGCGYGRVVEEILNDFEKVEPVGVDLSQNYVDIFNKNLKPRAEAYQADIRDLPFKSDSFDVVFMITTLMYLTTEKDQLDALKEIFRVLKPKGKFVFIERNPYGHNLITFGGLVTAMRGKKNKEIDSVSFTSNEMDNLIKKSRAKVKSRKGFIFGNYLTPSLYISYSGSKI